MRFVLLSLLAAVISNAGPIENLKPGEWYQVPNSHLYDARPSGWSANVMDPWAGGIFDSKRDRLIVTGGGHSDYSGNELYAFDLNQLKWLRLTDPYPNPPQCQDPYPNGTPSSRHTYGGLDYISHADRFFMFGGDIFNMPGGCGSSLTWTGDLAALAWENKAPSGTRPPGSKQSYCAYDPVSKKVYFHDPCVGCYNNTGWYAYSFDQNTWSRLNSNQGGVEVTCVVDPARRLIIEVGGGAVWTHNLATPALTRQQIATAGGSPVVNADAVGLAFDSSLGRAVGWAGGSDVYSLDLTTRAWTRHAPAATNTVTPTAPNSNGTFGRFRYSPHFNVFVVVNRIDENVFIYRLTAGSGTGEESKRSSEQGTGRILITPNPVTGGRAVIAISGGPAESPVILYDLRGRNVARFSGLGRFDWNTEKLPAGVYSVKWKNGNKSFAKKITVVN